MCSAFKVTSHYNARFMVARIMHGQFILFSCTSNILHILTFSNLDCHVVGALLSHLIAAPIYLSSVTVASGSAALEICRPEQDFTDRPSAIWTDSEQGFGAPNWTEENQLSMTATTLEAKDFTFDAIARAVSGRLAPLGQLLSQPYSLNVVSGNSHCV